MLGPAISISLTFLHFNNIACSIYRKILPYIADHFTAVQKFVPTTTIETHRFIQIERDAIAVCNDTHIQ